MTTLLAFDLSQERLIGFALLGPRREKLTDTTMQARAKVHNGAHTRMRPYGQSQVKLKVKI